jgi:phosphate starvation-inducible membrane PsiE
VSKLEERLEKFGDSFLNYFHIIGLFVVTSVLIWTSVVYIFKMFDSGVPTLKDILMLFIHLEIGAMIAVYFKTKRLPVQFLIYITITALTRVLTIDVKTMDNWTIVTISGAILIMAITSIVLQYRTPERDCEGLST